MKILIVEDEAGSRLILERFLSPCGECHFAKDGEEAMRKIHGAAESNAFYDLICLDIQIPKKSGLEVLKEIRQQEKEDGIQVQEGVKIIMTTQVDAVNDVLGAFKSGCEAYVVKPIDKVKLLKELRKLDLCSE